MAGALLYRDFVLDQGRAAPIPRGYSWSAVHKDYDPTPTYYDETPADDRCFYGSSKEDVHRQIDDWYLEQD